MGCVALASVCIALGNPMALLSKTTYSVADRPATAQAEHRQIVDAIKQGDTGAAEKLGYGHIANAEQAFTKLSNVRSETSVRHDA